MISRIIQKTYRKIYINYIVNDLTIVKIGGNIMKVTLCIGDVCIPQKCPVVDVQEDKVIIGEKKNVCTLTRAQFNILREKILRGEL
jgi:hypothetical protein